MPEPDSAVMNVSMDGVLINIRGEGWKEVKTLTISAVEAEVALERDEEKEVRLTQHSYRAGLWEAQEFAKQQWAEGCRRGWEKAHQIVSVNDGALWIWLIVAMCYAPCVEIIDGWHAVKKIWGAANSLWGQGEAQTLAWVQQQKDRLWAGQLRPFLHEVRSVCPRGQPFNDKSGPWSVMSSTTGDGWTMSLIARLVIRLAVVQSKRAAKSLSRNA
ncbi:MAG: hypothetical protein HYR94_21525 [Chloroflexi bacterium]|nr:hypothetical protein [Chloroflexota bacterium]